MVRGDLGDLLDPAGAGRDALAGADVIFHLAAAVSSECEADFDLGMRANLRATERLLSSCRALGTAPVVVFASSVAVFGASVEHPLPAIIDDHTLPNPQSSYGVQKFIGEQLMADYTRKGFLRGRTVRLMTVSVRPGRPNAAASSFLSAHHPGAARRPARDLPRQPADRGGTGLADAGPSTGCCRAATASDQDWGGRTAVNLPALTVTVAGMVAALERVAGAEASALIDWVPDPAVASDRDGLARPVPRRPGRPAWPRPGSRLRLDHQDASGRGQQPARRPALTTEHRRPPPA